MQWNKVRIWYLKSVASRASRIPSLEKKDKGFVYIVFGRSYCHEAYFSIQSLRRFHAEPVLILTDEPGMFERCEGDTEVRTIKPKHKRAKIDYLRKTPFDKTIYLDSDTIIVRDISDLFELLERFDVLATIDFARKRNNVAKKIPRYDRIPYAFSEVNGGLLGFNSSPESVSMLDLWRNLFYKYHSETNGWDQPSLRIALWESAVRIATLPAEYNIRPKSLIDKTKRNHRLYGESHMQPRIFHGHYSPAVHDGKMEIGSLDELEQIIREKAIRIEY